MLVLEQSHLNTVGPMTEVLLVDALNDDDRCQMFSLYQKYYEGSNDAVFNTDLSHKTHVILLRDQGAIQGFSTLMLYQETFKDKLLNVLYSGDTIVDKAYWGQPLLPKAWLQLAGQIMAESSEVPLYWLLIVKGHRTYKYLPLFSQAYYPRYDIATPPDIQQLMDQLAFRRFGQAYQKETGLVYFTEPRSFLSPELAVIPEKDLKRSEVQFFLSKNPHYAKGDELVCLCKLCPENLTRVSRNWFLQGMQQAKS